MEGKQAMASQSNYGGSGNAIRMQRGMNLLIVTETEYTRGGLRFKSKG